MYPLPSHLIEQFGGKKNWITREIREALPLIDRRLNSLDNNRHFEIDCSNLKLLLRGKIYKGMGIVE